MLVAAYLLALPSSGPALFAHLSCGPNPTGINVRVRACTAHGHKSNSTRLMVHSSNRLIPSPPKNEHSTPATPPPRPRSRR